MLIKNALHNTPLVYLRKVIYKKLNGDTKRTTYSCSASTSALRTLRRLVVGDKSRSLPYSSVTQRGSAQLIIFVLWNPAGRSVCKRKCAVASRHLVRTKEVLVILSVSYHEPKAAALALRGCGKHFSNARLPLAFMFDWIALKYSKEVSSTQIRGSIFEKLESRQRV